MAPRLLPLAALAFGASPAVANTVSCGGHFAYSCAECAQDNGESWCHGDCRWLSTPLGQGQCVPAALNLGSGSTTEGYMGGFLVSGCIMLVWACFYNQKVIKGPPSLPKVNYSIVSPTKRGLFDCIWHMDTCLYTAFCMPIVAAKNYHATDVCPFWPGCILTFLGTYSPLYCVTVLVRTCLSGRVQDKLGVPHNCCMDFIYNFFCMPCTIGQESLEVDAEIGANITCCCNVSLTPRLVAGVENAVDQASKGWGGTWAPKYRMCGGDGH